MRWDEIVVTKAEIELEAMMFQLEIRKMQAQIAGAMSSWSMFEPIPHFMKTLTIEIKRLSEDGLTPEQIAERIET